MPGVCRWSFVVCFFLFVMCGLPFGVGYGVCVVVVVHVVVTVFDFSFVVSLLLRCCCWSCLLLVFMLFLDVCFRLLSFGCCRGFFLVVVFLFG